jgi:hypothetical protein
MPQRPWWAAVCGAGAIALLWCPEWVNRLTSSTAVTWLLTIVSLVVPGWVSLSRLSQRGNSILIPVLTRRCESGVGYAGVDLPDRDRLPSRTRHQVSGRHRGIGTHRR